MSLLQENIVERPLLKSLGASLGRIRALDVAEAPDATGMKILVFDLDSDCLASIEEALKQNNVLTYCRSDKEISNLVDRAAHYHPPFDAVIWGLAEPLEQALEEVVVFRERHPTARLIVLAPQEALVHAALIKRANPDGFVLKPLRRNDLLTSLERVMSRYQTRSRSCDIMGVQSSSSSQLDQNPDVLIGGQDLGLIGTSPQMRKIFSLIRRVGPSSVNVLITGESGTGKEMVARAIHGCSDRSKKPFLAINCAAIPRELLESELFGHVRGAFTGAVSARRGLFEEANEGTILLDEIGDLPMSLQAKILRLIQTRQVKPLGQNQSREVDVRIISATHKNLKSLIQKGEFREDLFYRLNVMPIHLPPLRDRRDDIPILAHFFLKRFADRRKVPTPHLTREAETRLADLPWSGNVRELENVIERAIVLSDGKRIQSEDVCIEDSVPCAGDGKSAEDLFNSGLSLREIEREYIRHVLERVGHKKEAAIRILGIDRKTLYRKEKLYGFRSN